MADATMVSFPGPLGPGPGENPRRSLPCEPPANPPANPLRIPCKLAGNALETRCKRAANSLGARRLRPPHSSKIDARFDPQSRTSACAMATRHRSPPIGQPMAEAPMNVAAQLWARKFSVNHRRLPVGCWQLCCQQLCCQQPTAPASATPVGGTRARAKAGSPTTVSA